MDRKQEVLRQLREADGYVSGQQLCEALGVSRTAVWKIINRLKEDGYPIEAVTNKGYRLLQSGGTGEASYDPLGRPSPDLFGGDRINKFGYFRILGQGIPAGNSGSDLQADDRKGKKRTYLDLSARRQYLYEHSLKA